MSSEFAMPRKVLGLIPARSGSKGIPGKNLRLLGGVPLLSWPIVAAQESKIFAYIVCSTDTEVIAEVAQKYGAEIPFLRPPYLARDETPTSAVILHVIEELEKEGNFFDDFVLLEPTSPLTTSEDVKKAYEQFLNSGADSLISVAELVYGHPFFTFDMEATTNLLQHNQAGAWQHLRRQDLPKKYFMDGSLYISKVATFKKYGKFIQDSTVGYCVPSWKSFEIDDGVDLEIIETIMRHKGGYFAGGTES